MVLGFDARASSPILADAVVSICGAGADVLDIGLAGTEEGYASVSNLVPVRGLRLLPPQSY